MASRENQLLVAPIAVSRWPIYYGWVNVVMGALAMTATLPGRTHGLGLITKPLLEDLEMADQAFANLNFWAILLGACMALPVGWMVDRLGSRIIGSSLILALGAAVVLMSMVKEPAYLFPSLLLVRGLGQGALSIVSVVMVGKWFSRRLGPAMGVFAVLLAIGFIASTLIVGKAVQTEGWRPAWLHLGYALLVLAPINLFLVRSTPASIGLQAHQADEHREQSKSANDATLWQALGSPAFWIYSLASALFGLVWSAVTLFSESILDEHGFGPDTFLLVMAILAGFGLVCNLLGGWLSMFWPMGRLLGISMMLLAAALIAFPWIRSDAAVVAYALALGGSGGLITVVFFAFYGQAFGRSQLGRIQGAAHILSVFASALGPVLLTLCKAETGSYDIFFLVIAPILVILGLAGWWVSLPAASQAKSPLAA